MPQKDGYHYAPAPNDRQPAKQAPYAYMKTAQPSRVKAGGKGYAPGSAWSGTMNTGGKRRPGRLGK